MLTQNWPNKTGKAAFFTFFFCGAALLGGLSAQAQTLTENNRMTFGRIVMHDNSSQKDLRLLTNGSYVADPGFYVIDMEPELGSYTIQGQVPNRQMIVTFTPSGTINRSGPGPFFTITDFFTVPPVIITNGAGEATFQVGATLRSSGFMGIYPDDRYRGDYTISVNPVP